MLLGEIEDLKQQLQDLEEEREFSKHEWEGILAAEQEKNEALQKQLASASDNSQVYFQKYSSLISILKFRPVLTISNRYAKSSKPSSKSNQPQLSSSSQNSTTKRSCGKLPNWRKKNSTLKFKSLTEISTI
jgi:hypothetical protein